jgi:hypothetical protein
MSGRAGRINETMKRFCSAALIIGIFWSGVFFLCQRASGFERSLKQKAPMSVKELLQERAWIVAAQDQDEPEEETEEEPEDEPEDEPEEEPEEEPPSND